MRVLFIFNTLFELVVMLMSLFLLNNLILAGNALALTTLSALSIGASDGKQIRPALITFAIFHTAITLAWLYTWLGEGTLNPAMIGHGLFAIAFWTMLLRADRSRPQRSTMPSLG